MSSMQGCLWRLFGNCKWSRAWLPDTWQECTGHITPILWQLYWFPISFWCQFKVFILSFKAQDPHSFRTTSSGLILPLFSVLLLGIYWRSPAHKLPRLVSTRARTFSVVAPILWTQLSEEACMLQDLPKLHRACKAALLEAVFGWLCLIMHDLLFGFSLGRKIGYKWNK